MMISIVESLQIIHINPNDIVGLLALTFALELITWMAIYTKRLNKICTKVYTPRVKAKLQSSTAQSILNDQMNAENTVLDNDNFKIETPVQHFYKQQLMKTLRQSRRIRRNHVCRRLDLEF